MLASLLRIILLTATLKILERGLDKGPIINDGDGGAGLAYYQPANMALDSHVTALIPLIDMSAFVMLFIAKCISGLHGFFGHGLSISNPRAKRLRIMLPVTDSGEPDYEYMEQYAKNMMLRKYRQYLTFLQQRSNAR